MGKHKGAGSDSFGLHGDDSKHDQKLQAVLFGDSFTHSFRPITLDKNMPKVLCPLNNVAMLDYCMEFLAGAGVQEIFVICVHGAEAVEAYVRKSSWSTYIDIHCIRDSTCMTPGDALRELDKRSVIRSNPFLLMNGDVVTNINILPTIEAHKIRYKADSSAIMTMLFQRTGSNNVGNHMSDIEQRNSQTLLASANQDLIVGLNPKPNEGDLRMVLYDDKSSRHKVTLPCDFFQTVGSSLELRTDLMPVGLDVCSPEVLSRFSDEFDYQDLYNQFVHESVLEEEEGLQSKIYAHLIEDGEYGARAKDFQSYHAISRDMMRRWCYPPVGLDNMPSGYESQYRYETSRQYVYREVLGGSCTKAALTMNPKTLQKGFVVGRSSQVGGDVILGANVRIGEACFLKGAVIGNNVRIGNGVKIVNSHIWDDVVIADHVRVNACIVAQKCTLKEGVSLKRGCILGKGCVIGANVTIDEFTRLTACSKSDEADNDDSFDDADMFSSSDESSSEEESDDSGEELDSFEEDPADKQARTLNTGSSKNVVSEHGVVGKDGVGRVYGTRAAVTEDNESIASLEGEAYDFPSSSIGFDVRGRRLQWRQAQVKAEREDALENHEDNFSDDEPGKEEEGNDFGEGRTSSFGVHQDDVLFHDFGESSLITSEGEEDDMMVKWGQQRDIDIVGEMKALCMEHEKSSNVANLAIELNSFKFSQNASFSDCTTAAFLAVLERMAMTLPDDAGPGKMVLAFQSEIDYWLPLFEKFRQSSKEEMAVLQAAESAALSSSGSPLHQNLANVLSTEPGFRFLLQTLEDKEVVKDSTILTWAKERQRDIDTNGSESLAAQLFLQQATQDYLEWLAEESESESSDDGDDDEEEESSGED